MVTETQDEPVASPTAVRCRFLGRSEDGTPADIHECGRTRSEHPVGGMGRFENHTNHLDSYETISMAGKRRTEYADDAPPERLAPLGAALSLEGKLQ